MLPRLLPRNEAARGLGPAEMLPPVQRNHLPGHGRALQYEADRARDLRGLGAMPEWHRRLLVAELLRALALAGQGRPRADAVDPDVRRQGESHGAGEGPQPDLGHGIGNEVGGELPDPLVQEVDDVALAVLG